MNRASWVVPEGSRIISEYAMSQADFRHGFTPLETREPGLSHVRGAVPAGAVNLSLSMLWRPAANFAKQGAVACGVESSDVA